MALVSASAERSFYVTRRIKTLFISTMKDINLSNLMFANIYISFFDNIDLRTVADDFAKISEILINYFG